MRAEDILPGDADTTVRDGVAIRKGTVGAFLANALALRDPAATDEARAAALRDIGDSLPALRALRLFDVFEVRDPALRALVEGGAPAAPVPAAPDLNRADPTTPDLDALYAQPSPMIRQQMRDYLVDVHEAYLKAATFFCLATASGNGLDASPRGGPAGFVRVLDPRTVAFADWPGNNRIESMRNLERDTRVGMLFLFPGFDAFLRINGHAAVSTDPALLEWLAENGRTPKAATVVHVNEVLFHCGKAANRARLWDAASHIGPGMVPSVGKVISTLADTGGATVEQLDAHYAHEVRHTLY